MKSNSSLRRLPTTKSIGQEKPKFLVIILCEDQNIEFQHFCLDIYDQSLYIPDENLAKIQIVSSYEEFEEMLKEPNREYFILSSDKAIQEIQDLINVRQKWVIYDSSKKGSIKRIYDLPNVVFKTRQIQSLREKLESRKFISKQKLFNEKIKQIQRKKLQNRYLVEKSLNSPNLQKPLQPQNSKQNQGIKRSSFEKGCDQKQSQQKGQRKVKIIKFKSNTQSNKLLKTQKQIVPNSSISVPGQQVKKVTQQLRKTKSNQNIFNFQPINSKDSLKNLNQKSKNQYFSYQRSDFKKEQNNLKSLTKQTYFSQEIQNLNSQTCPDQSLLLYSVEHINKIDDYELQKIPHFQGLNTIHHPKEIKKGKIKLQHQTKNSIPLSKQKSISLNYFANRNKLSDRFDKNKLTKNNVPKNPIQMRLHHSKSQLKNRSLLSRSKSLNAKLLSCKTQNLKSNQKNSSKQAKPFKRYLSSGKKADKRLRALKQEISTIQSEEYQMSPLKTAQSKISKKIGLKRPQQSQNCSNRVSKTNVDKKSYKKQLIESNLQLSALFLFDVLMPENMVKKVQSLISCNDSAFGFRCINQLRNQIKQSENVYELIFVFNWKTLSQQKILQFQQSNPYCHFVTIDQQIEEHRIQKNKIMLKNFNNFSHIIQSIISKSQYKMRSY